MTSSGSPAMVYVRRVLVTLFPFLEGASRGLDLKKLGNAMLEVPGVVEVHDLRAWTITSGFPALAAHVLVEGDSDCHEARRQIDTLLHDHFAIEHSTLRVERPVPQLLQLERPSNSSD